MKLITALAAWLRLWRSRHQKVLKSLYYDITEALILAAAAAVMTGVLYVWIFIFCAF